MSEDKGVIYIIRWELLVIFISLILIVSLVISIPHDYSQKLLEERKGIINNKPNTTNIKP